MVHERGANCVQVDDEVAQRSFEEDAHGEPEERMKTLVAEREEEGKKGEANDVRLDQHSGVDFLRNFTAAARNAF